MFLIKLQIPITALLDYFPPLYFKILKFHHLTSNSNKKYWFAISHL